MDAGTYLIQEPDVTVWADARKRSTSEARAQCAGFRVLCGVICSLAILTNFVTIAPTGPGMARRTHGPKQVT